jgi:hypothetical protein
MCISAYNLMSYFHCHYLYISFFSALAEYQPQVYSTLLFSPATQICCSEGDGLKFFYEEFSATCCPGYHSCGVMESSTVQFHRESS